jgi:hypothetical protein
MVARAHASVTLTLAAQAGRVAALASNTAATSVFIGFSSK